MAHKVFILFLVFVSVLAVVAVALHGFGYYLTPVSMRHLRGDYEQMKPSGNYSHGLGILGASMIIVGVSTYSTRKRVRALWDLGKLSGWLEFHIFLCLLGPILVVFHTTFKAGGVAAISLWTMLAVASSGIIGRFLYAQIPKNIQGNELTAAQITGELDRLSAKLSTSKIGERLTKIIFQSFEVLPKPQSVWEATKTFVKLISLRLTIRRLVHQMVASNVHSKATAKEMQSTATAFASLIQKSLVLSQAGKLFYYWHVIHLPFSIIMFITLAAHVAVTVLLGYRWIF
jgi:hypothetical protein